MICPRCNKAVKDDVAFCIFCGMPLNSNFNNAPKSAPEAMTVSLQDNTVASDFSTPRESVTPAHPSAVSAAPAEAAYEPFFSPDIPVEDNSGSIPRSGYTYQEAPQSVYAPTTASQMPADNVKQYEKKSGGKAVIIILSVLLAAAFAFGLVMLNMKNDAEQELVQARNERDNLQSVLGEIKDFANFSSCGYASEDFHVNKGVVVLSSDKGWETLDLTTAFSGGGTYSSEILYGSGAYVEFDEDTWSGDTTTVTVYSNGYPGDGEVSVTEIEFSNSLNSQTFSILVLVMD